MWVLLEETTSVVRMQGRGLGTPGDKEEPEEPEEPEYDDEDTKITYNPENVIWIDENVDNFINFSQCTVLVPSHKFLYTVFL